jgi:hypothetical protein
MLGEPFHPYSLSFRNACDGDIEISVAFQHAYSQGKYLLKPGVKIGVVTGTARMDYGENADVWQKFLAENDVLTISTNQYSRTLGKQQIIELLKNKDTHTKLDATGWIISDASLCP